MKHLHAILIGFLLLSISIGCYGSATPKKSQAKTNKTRIIKKKVKRLFDCPIILIDGIQITSASCDNSDGGISGVKVISDNKLQYTWYNAAGKNMGNKLNLTGVPPGDYTLEVIDNAGCVDGVKSPPITVDGKNKVTIKGIPQITTTSGCGTSDGSITGLNVTNATKYVWTCVETSLTYTSFNTADVHVLPQGTYTLTASNGTCSTTASAKYSIFSPQGLAPEFPSINRVTITQPTCGLSNSLIVITFSRPISTTTVYWVLYNRDKLITGGEFVPGASTPTLTFPNLSVGDYHISVGSQANPCFTQIGSVYTIREAKVMIYPDSSDVVNDKCNQHVGAINPYITGSTPPKPQSGFTWTNFETGEFMASTKVLQHVGAGTYKLDVADPNGCTASAIFVVRNDSPPIPAPTTTPVTVCLPGKVFLYASSAEQGGEYRLYASPNDVVPLATSKTGTFNQRVDETADFYISYARSDCESVRTKVKVTVLADIHIPNSFTPNNDGVNDTWIIKGLEKFPGSEVRLFERNGQQVFHSIDNAAIFEGYYKNKALPSGVYYYTIDVKDQQCYGKISGTLTLLR